MRDVFHTLQVHYLDREEHYVTLIQSVLVGVGILLSTILSIILVG
jgi:hypothetical protein